jgi:hypothetical protein
MQSVWLPMLEANQGLLSLLALSLAIGLALWEQHRANKSLAQWREERAAFALKLINNLFLSLGNAKPDDVQSWKPLLHGQSALLRSCGQAWVDQPMVADALFAAASVADDALDSLRDWPARRPPLLQRLDAILEALRSRRYFSMSATPGYRPRARAAARLARDGR